MSFPSHFKLSCITQINNTVVGVTHLYLHDEYDSDKSFQNILYRGLRIITDGVILNFLSSYVSGIKKWLPVTGYVIATIIYDITRRKLAKIRQEEEIRRIDEELRKNEEALRKNKEDCEHLQQLNLPQQDYDEN